MECYGMQADLIGGIIYTVGRLESETRYDMEERAWTMYDQTDSQMPESLAKEKNMPSPELVRRLDVQRKKYNIGTWIGITVAGIMLIWIMCDSWSGKDNKEGKMDVILFVEQILLVVSIIVSARSKAGQTRYRKDVKEKIISPIIREHFEHLTYSWEGIWSPKDIMDFDLISSGGKYQTEDYISSEYHGIRFEQADVHSYGDTNTRKVGPVMESGRFFVFRNARFGDIYRVKVLSKGITNWSVPTDLKKIDMENVAFNQRFDVYSASVHNAFFVLTPQVMERMIELHNRYSNLAFHFTDGKVYVCVDKLKDAFEVELNKPIDINRIRGNVAMDVQVIKDLIDTMNLIMQDAESVT